MNTHPITKLFPVLVFILFSSSFIYGQAVTSIIVEVKTGDKNLAGTDDATHLFIGGRDFNLDNPNKDDLERNQTDLFVIPIDDLEFNVEIIQAVGRIGIIKTGDSFFGGGWYFQGIKIWLNSQSASPIYTNNSINKWLDGDIDERSWFTTLGEAGWNLPEPPPFPPCTAPDVIFLTSATSAALHSPTKPDSDCDGIPDDADPTFDPNQPDQDGDGLPDVYEEQNGSNKNSNDTDGDQWLDNKNIKDILILTKIECLDQTGLTNLATDEVYLVAEDVRFPLSPSLNNYWEMDAGTSVEPHIIIDSRVPGNSAPQYKTRLNLREADFPIFEHPMDDSIFSQTLDWGRDDTKEINYSAGDSHYKLYFKSFTVTFMDPSLTDFDGDADGLSDSLEFLISTQSPALRPASVGPNEGYNGLASPLRKQLFLEVDAVGSDDKMPFDAKAQVASQFYFHNISTRIDDGYLGGGNILPYTDEVTFTEMKTNYYPNHHFTERRNHYRYALFVPSMGGKTNGRADRPGKTLIVSRSTMVGSFSAIVLIHELGHTLTLCHPFPTVEPPSPSDLCPTPPNWNGFCSSDSQCNPLTECCISECSQSPEECCSHYCGVGDDDVTAMGSDVGAQEIVIGGAIGIMVGLAIIALFIPGIGWILGPALLAGAALLGAVGGFLFSDAYLRLVDYHIKEWPAIVLNVF